MKKSSLNIVIDSFSLLILSLQISTGCILKFTLPHGSGSMKNLLTGIGWREKTISTYWGLTRQDWALIHFCISITFIILMITHIYMHWEWVKSIFLINKKDSQTRLRKFLIVICLLLVLFSLLFPWIAAKKTYTKSEFIKYYKYKPIISD